MRKKNKCCKCGAICTHHKGYKDTHPDEEIIVIDKGEHVYCLTCFKSYIKTNSNPNTLYKR